MLICTAAMTPETSPRNAKLSRQDDSTSGGRRRTSLRLATSTPLDKVNTSSTSVDSSSTSKRKEEKYLGIGVMVDCKDDQGHWNQGRVIDINASARLLKIHYSGWHKRYDAWMPLSAVVAHGSRVKSATLTPHSLKQTNLRANLFRLNPNYVERSPSKSHAPLLTPPRSAKANAVVKESETSAASTTTSPALEAVAARPSKNAPSRVSPRTMIEVTANDSGSEDASSSPPPKQKSPARRQKAKSDVKSEPPKDETSEPTPARRTRRLLFPAQPIKVEAAPEQAAVDTKPSRPTRRGKGVESDSTKPTEESKSPAKKKATKTSKPPVHLKGASPAKSVPKKKAKVIESPTKVEAAVPSPTKQRKSASSPPDQKQGSKKRMAAGVSVAPLSASPPKTPQDVAKPSKKPRVESVNNTPRKGLVAAKVVEAPTSHAAPVATDSPKPSKSTLAEIFRNRVREQHLQPLPPKPHPVQYVHRGTETAKQRKQTRASNVMYMEHQEAFLRDSIQRWTQLQQDMIKDVTSVVVL